MDANLNFSHHFKALPPAIRVMEKLGFKTEDCLQGTGVDEQDLLNSQTLKTFTLDQQFRFHRNLLQLTQDPLLGLSIGRAYHPEIYGLFGYAFLSAPTLRHALTVVRNYGPLSFSLFKIDFQIKGRTTLLQFSQAVDIPEDLLSYYVDRDLVAVVFGAESVLPEKLVPQLVSLMHSDSGHRGIYEKTFGCAIEFNAPYSAISFDTQVLDSPMPMRDVETSGLLQQQCGLLLARISQGSGFVDKVRQLIIARPGYFPDIDYVAEKLHMTSRTLRRKLDAEGSSYQQLLIELRYQLAREYLQTSSLPLEEISVLLGYSAPGNFSHAFKRWHGSSPRQYRQEHR